MANPEFIDFIDMGSYVWEVVNRNPTLNVVDKLFRDYQDVEVIDDTGQTIQTNDVDNTNRFTVNFLCEKNQMEQFFAFWKLGACTLRLDSAIIDGSVDHEVVFDNEFRATLEAGERFEITFDLQETRKVT